MRVIDFHTHAFPDELAEKAITALEEHSGDYRAHRDGTIRGLLKSMDGAGIEQAVVVSIATKPSQVRRITEWSISIASERIIPFASIHPRYREFESELDRIAAAGLKGIKLHPFYQEFTIDDPDRIPLYRAVADRGLVVLFHAGNDIAFPVTGQASPSRFLRLFEAVPDLKMVVSHLGGWTAWEEVAETLLGKPVYLETSFAIAEAKPEQFRRILDNHPPDYFLFGTDSPWLDQKKELAAWQALPILEERKEKIFHKNAERLLGL
jgi:uncharacterized protein